MIAGAGHWARDAGEECATVVDDFAGLAVHELRSAHDVAAERRADGLVSQADAEDGQFAGEVLDERDADARLLRRARARREQNAVGMKRLDFLWRELVVPAHRHLGAKFTHVLHQVVGEGVVVVENENHSRKHSLMEVYFRRVHSSLCFSWSWNASRTANAALSASDSNDRAGCCRRMSFTT